MRRIFDLFYVEGKLLFASLKEVELTRGGCGDIRPSFADILMFEASRRHAFAFPFLSSSEMNTYLGLEEGRNLILALEVSVPERQEEVRINIALMSANCVTTHYPVPQFDLHLTSVASLVA